MGNYFLRDAITQQVIQTGEDVVLFNINNPLSKTNELLPQCDFSGGLPYCDNFSEIDGFALELVSLLIVQRLNLMNTSFS